MDQSLPPKRLLITGQLLPSAANGDRQALGEVFEWLTSELGEYTRCRVNGSRVQTKAQAEDVIQELFIKLGRLLSRPHEKNPVNRRELLGLAKVLIKQVLYDLSRPSHKDRVFGTPGGSTDNELLSSQDGGHGKSLAFDFARLPPPYVSRPDQKGPKTRVQETEQSEALNRAMLGVDEEVAAMLTLRYVKEMSFREIGRHLGMDHKTVQRQTNRALSQLRQWLETENQNQDD